MLFVVIAKFNSSFLYCWVEQIIIFVIVLDIKVIENIWYNNDISQVILKLNINQLYPLCDRM